MKAARRVERLGTHLHIHRASTHEAQASRGSLYTSLKTASVGYFYLGNLAHVSDTKTQNAAFLHCL